jgi:parallel beta-helix repeat protein
MVAALVAAMVLALLCALAAALFLQGRGITPRALAPYIDKRTSGHNNAILAAGRWSVDGLTWLDRGAGGPRVALFPAVGAGAALPAARGERRLVATSDEVMKAIATAVPGDVIAMLPGRYHFATPLNVNRPGSADAPIVVRAEQAGTVDIALALAEGFHVSAPYWRFENLTIRGVCKLHQYCEHAFHVTGDATHFVAVNNTIVDFNAHFKINGDKGRFPDHGRIEGNTLRNDSVRDTSNPVTLIDLVAASDWVIRRNLITDFVKGGGDRVSYGAFAKGAGSGNVLEQNVVLCESRLQGAPGQRVGLSLGGGGSGKPYCRDGKCITEQERGIIRSNLIANCSDDGIYLNNAAASQVSHNTLIDTGGMQVRFAGSSADIEGNLVDGDIRGRDGALLRERDNLSTPIAVLYTGYHAQRRLFADADALDLRWKGEPPRRQSGEAVAPDLCGVARPAAPTYGAFEDIGACLKTQK